MNPPGTDPSPAPASSPGAGASVQDWLNWLEAIHPAEIDLGLDRVLVVLRRLFPRKPNARIITVCKVVRVIHEGSAAHNATDGFATINQSGIDPSVAIHEVKVVSCSDVA